MSTIEGTPPAPPPAEEPAEVPKLRRRRTNRWVAGVSSGLADYFGLHPAVYRVLFVALAFAGGTGILLYFAAALVMPVEGEDESAATKFLRANRGRPWLVIGLALLALALIWSVPGGDDDPGDTVGFFILLVVVAAVALVWSRATRRDARRAETTGRTSVRWRVGSVVAALALVTAALVAAAAAALPKGDWGELIERPMTASQLHREYRLAAGQIELDLRDLELPPGETHIEAEVGFGEIDITLPPDVAAAVTADARWGGDIEVLGRASEGRHARERIVDAEFDDASRRIVVEARVRAGEISIRR
jgi:phage shock protein PspC (stress-responsive transcriptional regulator)